MANILFTGATGFVGRYLASALLEDGHNLICLVSKNGQDNLKRCRQSLEFVTDTASQWFNKIDVIDCNLAHANLGISPADIDKLKSLCIDEVWHVAGSVAFSEKRQKDTYAINVEGTEWLLQLSSMLEPRAFHFVSTAYVCGDTNADSRFFESELDVGQSFRNPYEYTKFQAEKLIRKWAQEHTQTQTFIYRPSIIVGESNTGKTSSFTGYYTFPRAFYLLKEKQRSSTADLAECAQHKGLGISVPGTGDLNIVTIDWATRRMLQLRNQDIPGTYHITASHPATFRFWEELTLDTFGFYRAEQIDTSSVIDKQSRYLNTLQLQFDTAFTAYAPYISGQPGFDDQHVKDVLKQNYEEHPQITVELVSRLLDYAIQQKFRAV
jgi:nucleoside-diphosphate-sugar epimerase